MHWLDITFIGLVAVSFLSGLNQGFSRSGAGLAALAAGAILGWLMYPDNPAAFALVLAGVILIGVLSSHAANQYLRTSGFEWADKLLGGAMGIVNGALGWAIVVVLLAVFTSTLPPAQLARSRIAPYALNAVGAVVECVPDGVQAVAQRQYDRLQKALPPRYRKATIPHWPVNEI